MVNGTLTTAQLYLNADKNPTQLRTEAAGRKLKDIIREATNVTVFFDRDSGVLSRDWLPVARLSVSAAETTIEWNDDAVEKYKLPKDLMDEKFKSSFNGKRRTVAW